MRLKQRTAETTPFVFSLALAALLAVSGCVSVTGKDPTLRTPGEIVDDLSIARQAAQRIEAADERLAASHVNVTSYHGIVLLTGEVQDETLRGRAESAIAGLGDVRAVHNELIVGSPTGFVARANDSWLATKVMSKFASRDDVDAARIKVVTADGVVYLMGVLPRAQANAAAEAARTIFGVRKVVKVFDYLDGT